MSVDPRAVFRRIRTRARTGSRIERTGWVAATVIAAPLVLPVFLGFRIADRLRGPRRSRPFTRLTSVAPPHVDPAAEAEMHARPDTFALVRILGNDLPPRHKRGQTFENLEFILAHEPDFPGCEKLWLVNRILDPEAESRLLATLEAAGQTYRRLPFDLDDYARAPLDVSRFPSPQYLLSKAFEELSEAERNRAMAQVYRLRNAYAMHNNGARNAAIDWGRTRAKWVLPWDGNCFLTAADWARLTDEIAAQQDRRYLVVPMARLGSNAAAFDPVEPAAALEEPQVLFRCDATERFDEAHPYGRRPKVELLARLGVAGPWRKWSLDPWDLPAGAVVPDSHLVGRAGLVRRLASGRADLEADARQALHGRGMARNTAIVAILRDLDRAVLSARGFDPARPAFFDTRAIARLRDEPSHPLAEHLRRDTAEALARGPFSVIDKTELPPSGDRRDYFHPAPYWWPNPRTADGLPFIQRDGERLPGTTMYAPESGRYDRTRLQLMFDDTVACSLAWAAFGDARARDHARRLVETWFLAPATAMTPHLRYAQVRRGHGGDEGASSGIIEFKDVAWLLDAVRLLDDPELSRGLAGWLRPYSDWLVESRQGRGERRAANNHGVYYDLQLAAIAGFLGDVETLLDCQLASTARLDGHFDGSGAQPHELARTLTRHYCAFNLQGWLSLCRLYRSCGFPLEHQPEFERLRPGVDWLLARRDAPWPYPQIAAFDADRLVPIAVFAARLGFGRQPEVRDVRLASAKPRFHPHDGIPPYWPLILDASDPAMELPGGPFM